MPILRLSYFITTVNKNIPPNCIIIFTVDCPSPNGIFADTTDSTCKRYYICANGSPSEYNCGPGTVFDPNLQVCNYESNYQCGDGTTEHQTSPQTPTGYLEIIKDLNFRLGIQIDLKI